MIDGFTCEAYEPTFEELTAAEGTWIDAWTRCVAVVDGTLYGYAFFGALGLQDRNDQVLFDNVRATIELAE